MAGRPGDPLTPPVSGYTALSGRPSPHLVTKAKVQQHVWAGAHVNDSVLRVSVQEIRQALGDTAVAPRYLETVGQAGYRFLGGGDREESPPRTGPLVGRQGEVEAPGRVVPAGHPRPPPTRLRQWGRRRWSSSSWLTGPPAAGRGPRGGSALSTTERGSRTCPLWKRWGSWATDPSAAADRNFRRYFATGPSGMHPLGLGRPRDASPGPRPAGRVPCWQQAGRRMASAPGHTGAG